MKIEHTDTKSKPTSDQFYDHALLDDILKQQEKHSQAEATYEEAIAIGQEIEDLDYEALIGTHLDLAEVQIAQSKKRLASNNLNRAHGISEETGAPINQVRLLMMRNRIHPSKQRKDALEQ